MSEAAQQDTAGCQRLNNKGVDYMEVDGAGLSLQSSPYEVQACMTGAFLGLCA
jgi:hypothetical protein